MLSWGGTRSNVQVTRPGVHGNTSSMCTSHDPSCDVNTNFSCEVHDVLVHSGSGIRVLWLCKYYFDFPMHPLLNHLRHTFPGSRTHESQFHE